MITPVRIDLCSVLLNIYIQIEEHIFKVVFREAVGIPFGLGQKCSRCLYYLSGEDHAPFVPGSVSAITFASSVLNFSSLCCPELCYGSAFRPHPWNLFWNIVCSMNSLSRKRISLRIAEYVSRQLKGWASKWLRELTNLASVSSTNQKPKSVIIGACSVLCSYYYGIMLLTRPFLIYELYEYLGASMRGHSTRAENLEKRKFADAALDASVAFVDTLQTVIASGKMPVRMPLIV